MKTIKQRTATKYLLFIILIISSAFSCEKHDIGHFREEVTNLSGANSIYDDYNSTSPIIDFNYLFHFSSNRKSQGNDFDIVGADMIISWNTREGTLEIESQPANLDYLSPLFDALNTSYNELGPYSLWFGENANTSVDTMTNLIIYANDSKGNFDLNFVFGKFKTSNNYSLENSISTNEIGFINTSANELYASFYGNGFYYHDMWGIDTRKIEKIIYCSDKDGNYDIYEVNISPVSSLIQTLQLDISIDPIKLALNSSSDDKCPAVNGKLLVFASNRSGGYGGYDLYYSLFENGSWSEPINFGDKINTEFDEYRPITLYVYGYDNNLMVFSSNRPGGKGGYDLYYTGIKQMIE